MSESTGEFRPSLTEGPVTSRDWNHQKSILEIPDQDFTGKKILDVGSGKKEHDAEAAFPGATVHALDPSFFVGSLNSEADYQKTPREVLEEYNALPQVAKDHVVIGPGENSAHYNIKSRVHHLPYADNSFDLVTSTYAVPMNINAPDRPRVLRELIRVTKEGGEIRLAPFSKIDPTFQGVFDELVAEFEAKGTMFEYFGQDNYGLCIKKGISKESESLITRFRKRIRSLK